MRSRLPMAPRRRRRPTVSRIRSNRVAVRPFPTGFSCRSTLLSVRSMPVSVVTPGLGAMNCAPTLIPQFDEHALVLAPGFLHLHPELQKNLHPEEVLHVDAGIGADRLQHRALLADHDGLLGLLFNIHGRADSGEPPLFLERIDPDRHRKRKLIARLS